jgi:hypothetical protein
MCRTGPAAGEWETDLTGSAVLVFSLRRGPGRQTMPGREAALHLEALSRSPNRGAGRFRVGRN